MTERPIATRLSDYNCLRLQVPKLGLRSCETERESSQPSFHSSDDPWDMELELQSRFRPSIGKPTRPTSYCHEEILDLRERHEKGVQYNPRKRSPFFLSLSEHPVANQSGLGAAPRRISSPSGS
ncbi:hypothetical protein M6B38_253055 [Iris pallida]|uniref:Uncharacterized protein n=1 Tax=Iris pallida TaxID=29817 RepID=A0AAX6IIE1_IRIPA|nr:hypothetical protein M6B38_253055 [Iris pallida]